MLLVLAGFGSVVPSESTARVFARTVPSDTEEATVTCTVNGWLASAARPVVFVQVTSWPDAEQSAEEPAVWNVRPAWSVSVTVKPPVLSDGPPLCTVSV